MTNSWSAASAKALKSADPRWTQVLDVVLQVWDCTVIWGERGKADQDEAVRKGYSKTPYPTSKHNNPMVSPSKKKYPRGVPAVDVAPGKIVNGRYIIDWKDHDLMHLFAGIVIGVAGSMGHEVRWGGNWDGDTDLHDQTFMDLVHFEMKG